MLSQHRISCPMPSRPTGFLRGQSLKICQSSCVTRSRSVSTVSSRYRGKGADMSKLPQFQMHETDVGSAQYQIARLTARIAQLTKHLQVHKKDLACERGLKLILSSRKKLLFYLYNNQRDEYHRVIAELGLRFTAQRFSEG